MQLGVDDEIRRMLREGHTYKHIKETLQVTDRRIHRMRIELGMYRVNDKKITQGWGAGKTYEERDRHIEELLLQGSTTQQIVALTGLSETTVRDIRRDCQKRRESPPRVNPERFGRAVVADLEASTHGFRQMGRAFTSIKNNELDEWIESLEASRKEISWLIREWKREQKRWQRTANGKSETLHSNGSVSDE